MGTYQELSPEAQGVLQRTTPVLREFAGEFARLCHKLDAATRGLGYETMLAIVDSLNPGELIQKADPGNQFPNSVDLSKERIGELIALADDIKELFTDDVKTACVEAAGPFRVLS